MTYRKLTLYEPVVLQVVGGDDAAQSGQVVDEVPADFSVVENSGTVFGDFSESFGQRGSDVGLAFL